MTKMVSVFFILCAIGLCLNGCKSKQSEVTSVIFEPSKVISNTYCGNIEDVRPLYASVKTEIHIIGWAADFQEKFPVKSIIVVADGKQIPFSPMMGIERKDVANVYKSDDFMKSGWNGQFVASELGKGKHKVDIYAALDNGKFAHLNYKGKNSYFEIEVVD